MPPAPDGFRVISWRSHTRACPHSFDFERASACYFKDLLSLKSDLEPLSRVHVRAIRECDLVLICDKPSRLINLAAILRPAHAAGFYSLGHDTKCAWVLFLAVGRVRVSLFLSRRVYGCRSLHLHENVKI